MAFFQLHIIIIFNFILFCSSFTHKNFKAYNFSADNNDTQFSYLVNDDLHLNLTNSVGLRDKYVDCFGIGASSLEWYFRKTPNSFDVRFYLSSRRQPKDSLVLVGDQFGLEWTDFKMNRKTVIIVHGFLSTGKESWIKELKKSILLLEDVNVVVVDWSSEGNTWNYYKAAINARNVGLQISRFLSHIVNDTMKSNGSDDNWGPIHMIGHSLGAHICGIAADAFKKLKTKWEISRITGLDPAQPCFKNSRVSLSKSQAPLVDVIHTNARFLSQLGLGLPESIGHIDFYPNGGKVQPGCLRLSGSTWEFLGIPKGMIEQAICSHGRAYLYFIDSIVAAYGKNGTFWGHKWDKSKEQALKITSNPGKDHYIEMGMNADRYAQEGTFFVITSQSSPFYDVDDNDIVNLLEQLHM